MTDDASPCPELIFDLGMNNGDDTCYYLRKGYRVVAIEANPVLCAAARQRFSDAVRERRLHVVNCAIWEQNTRRPFFITKDKDNWASLFTNWAGRDGVEYEEIEVDCRTLNDVVSEYGVPHFLKIDIEGADHVPLAQLETLPALPRYLSVEDCRFGFDYLKQLRKLGYTRYKLLDQATVPELRDESLDYRFPADSSGRFGEEVPGEWLDYDQMLKRYITVVRDVNGNRIADRSRWFDIHCSA